MIWKKEADIEKLQAFSENTMVRHVGIEFTEIGADFLEARMPVDARTVQPMGLLHGGASVVLAETLGSIGAYLCVAEDKKCVGLEISANHIRAVRKGWVIGRATPLHLGRTTQVWEIRIRNEKQDLVCVSRLTVSVL